MSTTEYNVSNNNNTKKEVEDDILSHCGSISGETFSSRRRKNTCSLRQHSIDSLARNLREYPFDDDGPTAGAGAQNDASIPKSARFNTFFHHYRFLVVMFGGFSVGTMFLLRYNITVSILRMVNHTHLYMEEHPDRTYEDFLAEGYSPGGEFNWNNEIQHMIMSWYMMAYTLPQVPCTKLGIMLGGRFAVPLSLSICAISTLLTPSFAYWGWKWVIFLRLINGLGGSAVLPMLLNLVEQWMPYNEISLGLSMAQTLCAILTATNPLLAGYLSAIHWSYSFYVPGICTLVFSFLWLILITDRPEDNYFISTQELKHICDCQKDAAGGTSTPDKIKSNGDKLDKTNTSSNKQQVASKCGDKQQAITGEVDDESQYKPDSFWQIFKVPSLYAYIIIWCFYCGSYSGFQFILPTYLRQFLKIKVAQNGIYCSIIQTGGIIAAIWPHPFLRLLQGKFGFSLTASRRITHAVLCSVVALTWIYVGAFHNLQLLMLFLNRCAHNSNDIVVTGCLMSNYAKAGVSSLAFSMTNTVGNLSVVFSSTFIGWLLDYTAQSRAGWCWILCGMGISQWLALLIFCTLINSDPIKFNNSKRTKTAESSKTENNSSLQIVVQQHNVNNPDKQDGGGNMLNRFDRSTTRDHDEPSGKNISNNSEQQQHQHQQKGGGHQQYSNESRQI